MSFVPFSRFMTVSMAAVVCFGLLVPLALQRHDTALVVFMSVAFAAYLVVNVVLWLRMRPRA